MFHQIEPPVRINVHQLESIERLERRRERFDCPKASAPDSTIDAIARRARVVHIAREKEIEPPVVVNVRDLEAATGVADRQAAVSESAIVVDQ